MVSSRLPIQMRLIERFCLSTLNFNGRCYLKKCIERKTYILHYPVKIKQMNNTSEFVIVTKATLKITMSR